MKRRVVVTGWGILTSLSCEVADCWNRVVNGESGIHGIELCDVSDIKVTIGGDLHDWNCRDLVGSKEEKKLDRFSQFAIAGAEDAMKSSGLDLESESDLTRFGCVLGSGIGGMATISEQMERLILKGPKRVSPLTIPKLMLNAGGGNIAIRYGLRGPNYSVATACASAANAMGNSLVHIQNGTSDMMVTGGSEAAMTRMGVSAFANMRALSTRTDEPTKASRPFDLDRDGFVFAEGAGILVFEELDRAKARGAEILGEVVGFGTSCDAGHITSPDEQGVGAAQAMQSALLDAELNAEDIDYINAHGTSTPLGDKAETRAIKTVFKEQAHKISISSTKSQLGHSLGASGGIELILAINALRSGVVPPTINLDTPDPDCDLDYTPNQAKERKLTYAMSNSFGFGGHNASVIVKRFED